MKSGCSGVQKPDSFGLSYKANKCIYAGLLPSHEIATAQELNGPKNSKSKFSKPSCYGKRRITHSMSYKEGIPLKAT